MDLFICLVLDVLLSAFPCNLMIVLTQGIYSKATLLPIFQLHQKQLCEFLVLLVEIADIVPDINIFEAKLMNIYCK